MTLVEILVALAVVLILISVMMGVGRAVKDRAAIDLTKGLLETLSTALEKYYDDFGKFPVTEKDYNSDGTINVYDESHLEFDLQGTIVSNGAIDELISKESDYAPALSASLFYFLDKNPASRAIVEGVPGTLVASKDASGAEIKIELNTDPPQTIDLPRYIDPWKTSIRYVYLAGAAFPVLTSAGPDRVFGTPDDITSK